MPPAKDRSIAAYRAKRDFAVTAEPMPDAGPAAGTAVFVVQKHDATRLHYDFRLEHGGVLWSWAVPKGPSLDPADKRLAVHVEDHPVAYATFSGTIPKGEYGAGTVEIWDRGVWAPVGADPAADLARGEMKFVLTGSRLQGQFVLIRLKPRPGEQAENWLLIKEHDAHEAAGMDASALDAVPLAAAPSTEPPAPGARHGTLPVRQAPQLATPVDKAPDGDWISEIKFDGYRLLAFKDGATVRLVTRTGLDWTARMPAVAAAVAALPVGVALLDTELVALRPNGVSSFGDLQSALANEHDAGLVLYAFDLLHLDGWDLRPCVLRDRKAAMGRIAWSDSVRFSDHVDGSPEPVRRQACAMGLEGIVAKRADAPYKPGRGRDWLKLKCRDREEFVVLGWTPPAGARNGLGSLHLGFHDPAGALHYVGGVGTGFKAAELAALRARLEPLATAAPPELLLSGERPDGKITWVEPSLVVEVGFAGWSGGGRIRHANYLGLREDKPAAEVTRGLPDPDAARSAFKPRRRAAVRDSHAIKLTHPDKELWPGITKQDLADYWQAMARHAMPAVSGRPLALLRCPDGIAGQSFFQKHGMPGQSPLLREGEQDGAPFLAFDDPATLRALAQMAAIELHSWGSPATDPAHADRLVFDLDPGDGVEWAAVVAAAHDIRARLDQAGLQAFCRTSGGKGLHLVVPVRPGPDWDAVRGWCRGFAEAMERDAPDRYVASVPKARRSGRILVDWLRNGLGSTAVASFSPRARPGATVATPLAWKEVTPRLDPAAFTLTTVPRWLSRQKTDPWHGFADAARAIPITRRKR